MNVPSVPAVPSGWLPIATAPRDGTLIDLWLPKSRTRTTRCYWGRPQHACGENEGYCDACPDHDGWVDGEDFILGYTSEEPSHWMPMPAAPDPALVVNSPVDSTGIAALIETAMQDFAGVIAKLERARQLVATPTVNPVNPVNAVTSPEVPQYLIISDERRTHGMVWFYAPDSKGYTVCSARAGRFTEAEAAAILAGTSGELSALRESDLPKLQILHHIDRGYGDNGAILKTLITHVLPSAESPPVNTVNPVTPETFESHGHIWTRHTPGDPCPVASHTEVIVLLRKELALHPGCSEVRKAGEYAWCQIGEGLQGAEIIGWRYAEPQPSTPAK